MGKYDYGYLWMLTSVDGQPAFLSRDIMGQLIYVIPHLDIMVVIMPGGTEPRPLFHIIEGIVVPAVLD